MRTLTIKIFIAIFIVVAFWAGAIVFQPKCEDFFYAQISEPFANAAYFTPPSKPNIPKPDINATAAMAVRINPAGRKKIIFAKEQTSVLPIASLTKLMTALVVLNNPSDYPLDKKIIISPSAAAKANVPIFGNFHAGNVYTVNELLNLMMYYSSNDAAQALAEVIGHDKFVNLMNDTAKNIGLLQTHFVNPTGLDNGLNASNTSSAADLVNLAEYIVQKQPQIFAFSVTPGPYLNEDGIFNINLPPEFYLIGGKTGFTATAGGCMILIFRDQKSNYYFNVVLGSSSAHDRVAQMQKLLDYEIAVIKE